MAQEYFHRTPTSTGNRKIFTYAGWFKKNNGNGSDRFDIFNAHSGGSQQEEIGFRQDSLRYLSSGSSLYGFDTTNKYRDTGNWFHIVFALNTTLESERKRSVLYINGVEVDTTTSSGIGAYVAKNFDSIAFNVKGKEHNVLARKYSSSNRDYVEGGGFDIFFVDGQALTPDVFGFFKEGKGYQSSGTKQATDFRPGQWSPHSPRKIKTEIERKGGFGVNGFYLPMNDSSNPGADFHCTPDSIIKLKGEDLPQPRNGAPTTSDAYVSELRQETGSLGFDGVVAFRDDGDYLQQPDSSDFTVGTNDYTIEFFANFSSDDGVYRVCGQRNSSAAESQFLAEYVNGVFYYYHSIGGSTHSVQARTHTSQWYHIAIVRQSQVLKLYIDGVLRDTNTTTGSLDDRAQPFSIGRQGNYTPQSFRGFLSNFRFVNGSAVYTTNNFTPPTEPLTAITNTKLLCCNSSTSATAATITPGTITAYNNVFATRNELTGSIILACPFVAGGFGQNGAANSTIPGLGDYHIALGGPSSVSAVNFLAGSGTQAEISGSNGLYYGSSLDVTSSSIRPRATVGTSFKLDGDYTIEFWAYINSFNSGGSHLVQYDSDSGQTGWAFSADNGTARFFLRNSNGSDYNISVSGIIPAGQWNHFAGVYESSKDKTTLYVNGVAVGTNNSVPSNYTSSQQYSALNRLHIGCNVGNGSRPMQGYMQDLRVYKGVAKYKGGFDVSKPYTPVGIEDFRVVSDTCKNNFATLNPNLGIGRQNQLSYAEGNLKVVSSATSGSDTTAPSNMAIKGKIYCEFALPDEAIGTYVGIMKYNTPLTNNGIDTTNNTNCWIMRGDNGNKANGEGVNGVSYGGAFSDGDIIMMAVDTDNGSIWWGRNGSWNASGNPSSNSNAAYTNLPSDEDLLTICGDNYSTKTPTIIANYGQNPTFGNRFALNKNRVNSSTADSVWHQSSNTGTHTDWTVSSGGTELDVAVPSGHYARVKLRSADGTIDPKKTYLLSFKYTTGPANLGVQNDQGYMTAVDGSASPNGLSSGNFYSFVVRGTSEVSITGFTGSTYALDTVVVSEIDECYTDDSGKGKFHYQPPTGYLALCGDNLPTPTIADPGKHFKTVLYTGDGNEGHSITGVGFKPDLVWIKCRSHADNHTLTDVVRGSNRALYSDLTNTEHTSSIRLQSFDTDGFTTGSSGDTNTNGREFCAWCWKAGGDAVTNNDGSITTQVSANPDAGFSIVKWTSNGNTSVTSMGHGLGKTPKFMIHKRLGVADNWFVYHSDIQTNNRQYLRLNTPDAAITSPNDFWSTSSSTMGIRQSSIAANGQDCIAYCWAEVEGFSKFGSYDGNGNADGPFVYCGFKPAWLMIKPYGNPSDSCYSGGYASWSIYDSSRTPVNDTAMHERVLFANRSYEEGKRGNGASSGAFQNIDLVSNGFKIRGNSNCEVNTSSVNGFFFAAFAESPFQTANAK